MTPNPNPDPHDSCHHRPTSLGDTFGGAGSSAEFREEDVVPSQRERKRERDAQPAAKARRAAYMKRWRAEHPANAREDALRIRAYKLRRRQFAGALLAAAKSAGCLCGEKRLPAIDLHHRDPASKLFNCSEWERGTYRTEAELVAEIAKCDPVCRNCHAVFHAAESCAELVETAA